MTRIGLSQAYPKSPIAFETSPQETAYVVDQLHAQLRGQVKVVLLLQKRLRRLHKSKNEARARQVATRYPSTQNHEERTLQAESEAWPPRGIASCNLVLRHSI